MNSEARINEQLGSDLETGRAGCRQESPGYTVRSVHSVDEIAVARSMKHHQGHESERNRDQLQHTPPLAEVHDGQEYDEQET